MLESPLTDFMVGMDDGLGGNALILVADQSFYLSDTNRLIFCPIGATAVRNGVEKKLGRVEIPIRKIEPDSSLDETIRSIVVQRPQNPYIRLLDISKSICWWVVNNADELGWPDRVSIDFYGTNGRVCSADFVRTGKKKWEPEYDEGEDGSDKIEREFNKIRKRLWNENV